MIGVSAATSERPDRERALRRLCAIAAEYGASSSPSIVEQQLRRWLGLASHGAVDVGRSTLNNTGAPLQCCLSLGRGRCRVRFIMDPGYAAGSAIAARLAMARVCLHELADADHETHVAIERLLACFGPASARENAMFSSGVAWIGVSVGEASLAAYVDLSPRDAGDAWGRLAEWLEAGGANASSSAAELARLRALGPPSSVGFERDSEGRLRRKVYVCTTLERVLTSDDDSSDGRAIASMIAQLARLGHRASATTFVSVGFDDDGSRVDSKIDLCCCADCTALEAADWRRILPGLLTDAGLLASPLAAALSMPEIVVAVVGVGATHELVPNLRFNAYLAPRRWRE
jgi:hypothetical protein